MINYKFTVRINTSPPPHLPTSTFPHCGSFWKPVFLLLITDRNGDGSLTKSEIRKYFKAHPIEKAHILGKEFTWKV